MAEPSRPPIFWLMPNSTEKLTRLRGSAITPPIPASIAGARKKALPNPSRNWLTISWAGRVRLLDWLSSREAIIINTSEVTIGQPRRVGFMVRQLATMPQAIPAKIDHASDVICSFCRPTSVSQPITPVFCSASTMRISSMINPRRKILPLESQRVFSSGLLRLCSKTIAETISTSDIASDQPIHGASNHHSSRPRDSTAHSSAMPGASRTKVIKSFFSNTLRRSPGGSLSAITQPSEINASPSSNRYNPRHSSSCSNSVENRRAMGIASDEPVMPMVRAFRRCFAGQAWI
ncbi:hypothetical protein D3C75_264560 [compost metagenome]